jgi:hypothetical protein
VTLARAVPKCPLNRPSQWNRSRPGRPVVGPFSVATGPWHVVHSCNAWPGADSDGKIRHGPCCKAFTGGTHLFSVSGTVRFTSAEGNAFPTEGHGNKFSFPKIRPGRRGSGQLQSFRSSRLTVRVIVSFKLEKFGAQAGHGTHGLFLPGRHGNKFYFRRDGRPARRRKLQGHVGGPGEIY